MKLILASLLSFLVITSPPADEYYLLVGTYTGGKSEGIYVYKFNSLDGSYTTVSHAHTSNPSFLAISKDQRFVYAVHEEANSNNKGGDISSFAFDKATGNLNFLNKQPSGGDHPCYVEIDKTGKWVVAGNYSGGNLSILPVQNDGSLAAPTQIIQHEGSGANKQRQDKPHVHCTLFSDDNRFLFVPDLGIDKTMIYSFDVGTGKLNPAKQAFAKSVDGSGPRHFTFHPNNKFAYLIEELSGTVVTYQYDKGKLKAVQRISTMPAGDNSFAGSADIHVSPDGKFLYASNRANTNNLAIYRVHPKSGTLSLVGHQSTLGKTPRNFNMDPAGNFLLVGNQGSDEIVIFKRNKTTGLLTDTGKRIEVGKPVCLKWIDIK